MLALTEEMREEMRVNGYTVMESFFQGMQFWPALPLECIGAVLSTRSAE